MGPFSRNQQTGEPDGAGTDERAVQAQGNIDSFRAGRVTGWALASVAGRPVPLLETRVVHESGQILGQGFATDYRADVQSAGLATAWCGFSLPYADDLPADGLLSLQVQVEGVWVLASQVPLESIATDVVRVPPDEADEYFADLLGAFASARTTGGVIGKASMRVGDGLWIQASGDVADTTRASLRLEESSPAGGAERAFIHAERSLGPASRIDIRFKLRRSVERGRAVSVVVPVRVERGQSGSVRLGVFTETGRLGMGSFNPTQGTWVSLEAVIPEAALHPGSSAALSHSVWLEVIAANLSSIDVGSPEIKDVQDSLFECARVGAQQDIVVFDAGGERAEIEPEDFSVVIPFFGNRAYTGHCVDAVLANSAHRPHVILVDDGTPTSLSQDFLGGLRERVQLVSFDGNRGYTSAVNAGVLAARTGKVVILNNDTRVTPGWDIPLLHALDDERVFAAGPLSNAASYQSVPNTRAEGGWAVNEFPTGVRPADLAAGLRARFGLQVVGWPILNGFCYAVRAEDFVDLGMLDSSAFPRGYGEEVDLLLRARSRGRSNVVVPGSFVYHYKSKTFSGQRVGLSAAANVALGERWGNQLAEAISEMDAESELDDVRVAFAEMVEALERGEVSA